MVHLGGIKSNERSAALTCDDLFGFDEIKCIIPEYMQQMVQYIKLSGFVDF